MGNFIIYILIAFVIGRFADIGKVVLKVKRDEETLKNVLTINKVFYWVSFILKSVDTLVHEFGHALGNVLSGGKINSIKIFASGGGEASTTNYTKKQVVITSLMGYPFSSIMVLIFAYLLSVGAIDTIFVILIFITLLSLVFMIRNKFGLLWGISFILILFILTAYTNTIFVLIFTNLLVALMLVENVVGSIYILYLSIVDKENSGDCKVLSDYTNLPTYIFGLLFTVISVVVFIIILAI